MKIFLYLWTLIFIYCNYFLTITWANQKKIDLLSGVKYLKENSPILAALNLEIRNLELSHKNAFATFWPTLDFAATHGLQESYSNNHPAHKNPWVSNLSLNLAETIYDNGISIANYKTAYLKKQKAELAYKKELDRLTFEFCNEFLNYSFLNKILQTQEEQLTLLKKQNEIISKTYYQGLKTKKDFLRSKTDINRITMEITSAKNNIERSKIELFKLISIPYEEQSKIDFLLLDETNSFFQSKIFINDITKDANISINNENYLEYKIGMLEQNINEIETSVIDKKNWPEFSATSGVTYATNTYFGAQKSWHTSFTDNDSTTWNVLFKVTYNILDWGIRKREKEMALNKQIIEKKQLDFKLQTLKTDTKKLILDLHEKLSNYKNSEELLKLEKDTYDLIYNEYRNGKVQYLDLITALKSLSDAKNKFYSAFYDLKKGNLNYHSHQGNLYDSIISN